MPDGLSFSTILVLISLGSYIGDQADSASESWIPWTPRVAMKRSCVKKRAQSTEVSVLGSTALQLLSNQQQQRFPSSQIPEE